MLWLPKISGSNIVKSLNANVLTVVLCIFAIRRITDKSFSLNNRPKIFVDGQMVSAFLDICYDIVLFC